MPCIDDVEKELRRVEDAYNTTKNDEYNNLVNQMRGESGDLGNAEE